MSSHQTAAKDNVGRQTQKIAVDMANSVKKKAMEYLHMWQGIKEMKKEEKYLWFGIHGGVVLLFGGILVLLAVSGASKGSEETVDMTVLEQENEDVGKISENEDRDDGAAEYEESVEETVYTPLEVKGGSCEAGSECVFGSYQMSEGAGKVGLEWIILEVTDNKAFVLSKYILPQLQPFNDVIDLKTVARWDSCSLRTWLNGSFYSDAFTDEQRSAIITTQVGDYDNRMGGSSNYTQDKIFCLSVKEVGKYTPLVGTFYDSGNPMTWWLRTEAETDMNNMGKYASFVTAQGFVKTEGFHNYQEIGVRPAMWIDLDMVSVVSY